jgi:hypothetical protein
MPKLLTRLVEHFAEPQRHQLQVRAKALELRCRQDSEQLVLTVCVE